MDANLPKKAGSYVRNLYNIYFDFDKFLAEKKKAGIDPKLVIEEIVKIEKFEQGVMLATCGFAGAVLYYGFKIPQADTLLHMTKGYIASKVGRFLYRRCKNTKKVEGVDKENLSGIAAGALSGVGYEYVFNKNFGYGTPDVLDALKDVGGACLDVFESYRSKNRWKKFFEVYGI